MSTELKHCESSKVPESVLPSPSIGAAETLSKNRAAKIVDPTLLGPWSFAAGAWATGLVLTRFRPGVDGLLTVLPLVLVLAGVVQLISGILAFRCGNARRCFAFCLAGSFNWLTAELFILQTRRIPQTLGHSTNLEGFVLVFFGFVALVLVLAPEKFDLGMLAATGTLAVGYSFAGIAALHANAIGDPFVCSIGGWFIVASAFFAFCTGVMVFIRRLQAYTAHHTLR